MSGFEDIRVAFGLWSAAGIWTIIALFTWEPVLRVLRNIKRIRIVIANSNGSEPKREEVGGVEEKGFLDHRVAVLKGIQRLVSSFSKYRKETGKFAQKVLSYAKNTERTQDAIKLHRIVSRFSNDIEYYSKATERFLHEYKRGNSVLNESFILQIPQIEKGRLEKVHQSIQSLLELTQRLRGTTENLRDHVLKLTFVTGDLTRASRRLVTLLEDIINEVKHTESFCREVLSILE